jgi:hypothetical protein
MASTNVQSAALQISVNQWRFYKRPVTVAERSEACTVFARLEAGIANSNPTKGMDVWYVYVLCRSVFR